MRVIATGGIKKPLILDSEDVTSLVIAKKDGSPVVLYKFLGDDKGFVRFTKGEDKTFDEMIRQLGLKF